MKKILALAICVAAAGSLFAQEEEAKALFEQGKELFKSFDKNFTLQQINPAGVDSEQMGRELIEGYNIFMKALPLDSMPNAKGKVNPKNSKKIINTIVGHANDFFNAGGAFYNNKKYYPEAYQAFIIYADMPSIPALASSAEIISEEQRATAYFNAGLAAYSGNAVIESARAFKNARLNNYSQPEAYIYEIACWQALAQRDSTLVDEARIRVNEVAADGYKRFGVDQPVFLNNLINNMIEDNKKDEAINLVKTELGTHPDNANLYGLLGFIYDRNDQDDLSIEAYRKAAEIESADYETLLNAAKKIFRTGTEKWNLIEGNNAEAREKRNDIKINYFEAAKVIAEKAKAIRGDKPDSTLNYLLESIQYNLDNYFPAQ